MFRVKPMGGPGYSVGAVLMALKTVFYRRQRFDGMKTMKMDTTALLVKYSRIHRDITHPRLTSDIRFHIFNNNNNNNKTSTFSV
jgi:hypothetical protein